LSAEITRRVAFLAQSNDPEFQRGSNAALKVARYGAGFDLDTADADLMLAASTAKVLADAGVHPLADRSAVTGSLLNQLFYNVVRP
jgi:hypothetical protein